MQKKIFGQLAPRTYSACQILFGATLAVFFAHHIQHVHYLPWWDELGYISHKLAELSITDFAPWAFPSKDFTGHPPGYPLLVWLLRHLIGSWSVAGRLISLVSTLLFLYFQWKIIRKAFDEPTALVATVLTVSFPTFFINSIAGLAETISVFLGFAAVWFYITDRFRLMFVFLVFAIYTRESAIAYVVAILLIEFFRCLRQKKFTVPMR